MSEQPTNLPLDVIQRIAPLVRAVVAANAEIESQHYFHLEVRYPGDGRVAEIDGDFPDTHFRFAWNPNEENKR